jgi:hypothetical protein
MKTLKITVEEIMQSEILYYDEEVESACKNICELLKIDSMPCLTGDSHMKYENNSFRIMSINDDKKISTDDLISSETVLRKFKNNKHDILFCYEGNILKGVVHICDYNKNVVLQKIQDDILTFERTLRHLMILSGKRDEDMIKYFKYKIEKDERYTDFYTIKIRRYNNKLGDNKEIGPFQQFDFSDLLNFCSSNFQQSKIYGIPGSKIEKLKNLRNLAMHGKNPIEKNVETSIYDLKSLENLTNMLNILKDELNSIKSRINGSTDYTKSIKLNNKAKLEIIDKFHPFAINYYLNL